MTTQVQMSVASANIANADTGYTEKPPIKPPPSPWGRRRATITSITSNVDKLLQVLMQATSALGSCTSNTYLSQLQLCMGVRAAEQRGTSLANTIATFESAISLSARRTARRCANAVSALTWHPSCGKPQAGYETTQQRGPGYRVRCQRRQPAAQCDRASTPRSKAPSGQPWKTSATRRCRMSRPDERQLFHFVQRRHAGLHHLRQALVDSSVHPLSYTAASSVGSSTYGAMPPEAIQRHHRQWRGYHFADHLGDIGS